MAGPSRCRHFLRKTLRKKYLLHVNAMQLGRACLKNRIKTKNPKIKVLSSSLLTESINQSRNRRRWWKLNLLIRTRNKITTIRPDVRILQQRNITKIMTGRVVLTLSLTLTIESKSFKRSQKVRIEKWKTLNKECLN